MSSVITLHKQSVVERMADQGVVMFMIHQLASRMRALTIKPPPNLPPDQDNPYCPYLRRALDEDTVWFGILSGLDLVSIGGTMIDFIPQFLALGEGIEDRSCHTAVITLPDFYPYPHEPVNDLRTILSIADYLPQGLVLGSLGMPIQSKSTGELVMMIHFFIVRYMVKGDWGFFPRMATGPEEHAAQLAKYRELFGEQPQA